MKLFEIHASVLYIAAGEMAAAIAGASEQQVSTMFDHYFNGDWNFIDNAEYDLYDADYTWEGSLSEVAKQIEEYLEFGEGLPDVIQSFSDLPDTPEKRELSDRMTSMSGSAPSSAPQPKRRLH